ncbi:Hydantoinase/oxoprolinase [Desulfonatronospira thiodismutans ASO3-1]|uniref:Hydantoinase/oxoprolinase n=1 Tax=Desulfonatronospira thiodismutans ASO3-1 TaxID=555779 RepID=D6SRK0_9BACT|nr:MULTISPECIES: hydantoinase/oxoprolinase family protein [Desulfonatronospira]EFI33316.1 Hydantoinase/oxoprolinase [Desulfonatronospira thiodismutans ASO3-1]RQD73322.1 MAG: hydantoinase/oxoprolinase family protein [Desulfonatronospira sp. MSAO_Bac3]
MTQSRLSTRNPADGRDIPKSGRDYVVGIDTGGTYTDGVLMDYGTREVLASAKTLTTYDDLTRGIIDVLHKIDIDAPSRVKLVGISSTLATNFIAEGNTKPVGLILMGYDQDLIESYGLDSRFATGNYAYFQGGHNAQGEEQSPPDLEGIKNWLKDQQGRLEALAISSYFSPLNPEHEEQAMQAVREVTDIPVVLGHQLSTQLDSIKRATTASLNASLVAVMHEFIQAVKASLKDLGIKAPLMIVKGDGSLMPYTEAARKPVETILSGPAASSIGGRFLSGLDSALVVDVGGTTTDMALIENGNITVSGHGARVGLMETSVQAARIRTVCIGCDSRISINSAKEFQVGPNRVVPLSRLAAMYPEVLQELENLGRGRDCSKSQSDIEYWFQAREVDPDDPVLEHPAKKAVLDLVAQRPLTLHSLLKKMRVNHLVQLNVEDLLQKRIIGVSTLTPTDLLHVRGELDLDSQEASRAAFKYICGLYGLEAKEFNSRIMDHIVAEMTREAFIFLARQGQEDLPEDLDGTWSRWLFQEGLLQNDAYMGISLTSRFPLIGIGAPAEIFVSRVARKLNARFELPRCPGVANAVGAVAGSVIVDKEALVFLQESDSSRSYIVQFEGEKSSYAEMEEALAYAEKTVKRAARWSAEESGAEEPMVSARKNIEGTLHRVQARAVGNPSLSEQFG